MDFKRVAAAAITVVFALAISSGSALASEKTDVVAAVHRYLDNRDKEKLQTALAMCDSQVSILDEFPPHEWHGPTACADWWTALDAYNEKSGLMDGDAILGPPWTVDVTGDRAYFVAPMTYNYKPHGKPVKESATFAVALKRTQAGASQPGHTLSSRTCRAGWLVQSIADNLGAFFRHLFPGVLIIGAAAFGADLLVMGAMATPN
jgi:hypothetical protein